MNPASETNDPGRKLDGLLALALDHRGAGRLEEALAALERLLAVHPDHAQALAEQGEVLSGLGRFEDAADSFALALAFDPSNPQGWLGYGGLLRRAGRLSEAADHLRQAVALSPQSTEAWFELALALNAAGGTVEAAQAYEQAITADPLKPGPYVNLGLLCLAQLGEPARAEMLFRRALELEPDCVETQTNIGLALHEQGRSAAALAHYDHLVQRDPGCVEYRWHRATVRLALGMFEGGWEDHEARKQRQGRWRAPFALPEWNGQRLAGGELLIHAEQGLGDEIMFASCIPDAMVLADCVIECDRRLRDLFERSFPGARVEGVDRAAEDRQWLAKYPRLTAECAIGSLPRIFRRSAEAFPQHRGYLVPDRTQVARWRIAIGGPARTFNVGIAWRGGTFTTRGELRSTALNDWAPLLKIAGARFFALQGARPEELREIESAHGVRIMTDGAALKDDIEALASLVEALDLVITVQASVAHIAGALGKAVWIVLNPSAEWRYLNEGSHMPWYPSARVFRRSREEAWDSVFERLGTALRPVVTGKRDLDSTP
ncbi:MAG: tetratricopeptide repeat protein [Burkholderiales bacterium]